MKEFRIEPTRTTFSVHLDLPRGIISFSGNSYPENVYDFFQPLINKLKQYLKGWRKPVTVVFKVNYFNTSSSKYLFKIMELFEQHKSKGYPVKILWHFLQGEEDMLETWGELMNDLDMEFQVVQA